MQKSGSRYRARLLLGVCCGWICQSCSFLKSKFQIGSCKGPINFKPTENVFHVDDIPPVKKAKKKEVRHSNYYHAMSS